MASYGTISKGIKLFHGGVSGSNTEYEILEDLMEIPELGGSADSIEITTLSDNAHKYMNGLMNYGDSLDFKFLYNSFSWSNCMACTEDDVPHKFKVEIPNGITCEFEGYASVKLDGVGVNAALTHTLSIKPSSEFIWA